MSSWPNFSFNAFSYRGNTDLENSGSQMIKYILMKRLDPLWLCTVFCITSITIEKDARYSKAWKLKICLKQVIYWFLIFVLSYICCVSIITYIIIWLWKNLIMYKHFQIIQILICYVAPVCRTITLKNLVEASIYHDIVSSLLYMTILFLRRKFHLTKYS